MTQPDTVKMKWIPWAGVALVVFGLLPVVAPTTYFRFSPLAVPVREHQRMAISLSECEICGAAATKRVIMPYEATMNGSGEYIGYNPERWPGNAEILLCEKHLGYSGVAKPKRLTNEALFYLLFNGNNIWLRLVLFIHLVVLVAGCLWTIPIVKRGAYWFMTADYLWPNPEETDMQEKSGESGAEQANRGDD
jgi:hypothetical protein